MSSLFVASFQNTVMAFPVKYAGDTYDLKDFMRDHPGGVNTLEKFKGRSIKEAMRSHGHSFSAYHMLSDFKVENGVTSGCVSENGRIITKEQDDLDPMEIEFLEELESKLDWSKPLLSQLHKIAPHYDKWVNSAVYRKCRLFESSLMESMTCTPWYLVPIFWIPIILYLGFWQFYTNVQCGESCTNEKISSFQYLYHIGLGLLIWTFMEYSLHRWIFHFDPRSSLILMQVHFTIHGMHHKVPFDAFRQVFPPLPALAALYVVYVLLSYMFTYPVLKLIGIIIGYLVYDMTHYYVHQGSPKEGTHLYNMKRFHSNHHFLNYNKAFGLSNKIWDHVFNTYVKIKKLNFSLHW